ncbi:MAG: HlyD family efflux transporter periplasmic adaptor subunit [Chitinophagaceae bacterium]|nr:MAG: HlyD family efflux transporter periplasmic adaptor subunit [Chitinophagaceae bacterium]
MPQTSATSFSEEVIYSAAIKDIISYKPVWIVRHGIMLFLIIVALIILMTFFIEYPDIVNANAKLVSVNPPVELRTKVAGKLMRLYVKEKDSVGSGTIIGEMESLADAGKVLELTAATINLKQMMEASETANAVRFFEISHSNKNWDVGLGEVQDAYHIFLSSFQLFSQYLQSGFYFRKKQMLNTDIGFMQRLHQNLLQQQVMQREDLALAEKTFQANESLSKDKVISAFDYRNEKSKLIGKSLSLPQLTASLISNESMMHEKRKEIMQLENEIAQQKNIFSQSLHSFMAVLHQWQTNYLIKSPVSGSIAFADFIQEYQFYPVNQTICLVNPDTTQYYAQVHITQNNFGKLKPGQEVLLKLPAYPYQEFGSLKGQLSFISTIPTDSGFIGKILLPAGLQTSQHKRLQYREGFKASAEIITSGRKLSDRVLSSFKSLVDRTK